MVSDPVPTMYAELGGDPAVRALVDRFYDVMQREPALAPLRALHAADLAPMRDKLSDWMCTWLGGPQRYFQRPDAVCIGAAHSAFPIDTAMRDLWLECMYRALDEVGAPAALQARVRPPLATLAEFLRNR
jgi:hemoglobin